MVSEVYQLPILKLRYGSHPHGTRTDDRLISALQPAWRLPKDGKGDMISKAMFSMELVVSRERKFQRQGTTT